MTLTNQPTNQPIFSLELFHFASQLVVLAAVNLRPLFQQFNVVALFPATLLCWYLEHATQQLLYVSTKQHPIAIHKNSRSASKLGSQPVLAHLVFNFASNPLQVLFLSTRQWESRGNGITFRDERPSLLVCQVELTSSWGCLSHSFNNNNRVDRVSDCQQIKPFSIEYT